MLPVVFAIIIVMAIIIIYLTSRCPCGCSCMGLGCAFTGSCCVGCKRTPHCDNADITMEFSPYTLDPEPGVAVNIEYKKNLEWVPGHPVRGTCGKVVSHPTLVISSEPIYNSYGEVFGDAASQHTSDYSDDATHTSQLTESFTDKLNNTRRVYLHSTNWCPHCKTMKPVWEQVKIAVAESNIEFYEIDEDVAKTPGINGFPTIRMLDEYGQRRQYPGGADFEQLRRWVVNPAH